MTLSNLNPSAQMDIARDVFDPDHQMPMPFPAALHYAQTVMHWAQDPITQTDLVALDQAYGEHRLQRFNVFAPKQAKNAPVLVFWHGGGWTNGYREYANFMARHVTALGFVLVAPSYRLAPNLIADGLEDSLTMLRHVAEHVGQWGGDAQRLYLSGHSAGGHLSTLTALRCQDRLNGVGRVCGALPISGIMDIHHPAPAVGSLEERVYTMLLADAAHDALFSPMSWTAGNSVPFVLTYGEHDSARVQSSNKRLAALLEAQGRLVSFHMEQGLDHFQTHTMLRDPAHPWYQRLVALAENV
ncbi:alpha/beta hydrolase [Variovorax sp. HJSM1_2]|uniref:alpha/beta hydrolase n=1 Tax=Variovorax sp. HJSM1_2 TaxID=3366263 RepID=UPI003BDB36EA